MNKTWLNKEDNKKLILFFNGWGMDNAAIEHLEPAEYDVVVLNDYRSMKFDEGEFSGYEEINVIAWSLGVWVASTLLNSSALKINKAIGINGTPTPVDEDMGIHPAIFKGTIDGWNEKNRMRFNMRVAGGRSQFQSNIARFGNRTVEDQKAELIFLYNHIMEEEISDFNFDIAVIGQQDAIFLPENQENYWQGKARCKRMGVPHYPFLNFKSWEEIVKL